MLSKSSKIILSSFIIWRSVLIIAVIVSFFLLENFSNNFFGGGIGRYNYNPLLYGWANFDGEHYLSIAMLGYNLLEQAFFPLYPILISLTLYILPKDFFWTSLSGLIISNVSFLIALIFLFKLLKKDYPEKFSLMVIGTILIFPTSFFFGALYNEGLFLLFSVLSFYFARSDKWLFGSLFGALASATRAVGILLLPALLIEAYLQRTRKINYVYLFLIPLGLLLYMYYQYLRVGDPLAFYNYQLIVGEQHQRGIVFLPQIFYRYLRIISSANLPWYAYLSTIMEFFVGIIFLVLPFYGYFKKIRLSYLFFALAGYLIPTIQGSFSSLPRYVIVLFPSFIAMTYLLEKIPRYFRFLVYIIFNILLIVETMLFIRGYWVA